MDAMRFAVRVKPGARRDAVGGQWDGALGAALIVAVRAPAVDGKANAALLRTLAAALSVRARDLDVVTGQRSRDKLIEWRDAPPDGADRLSELRRSTVEGSRPR